LVAALLLPHILLGLYAIYDGGFLIYGLTAPERFLLHSLSGSETHITLSGAPKYVADDLCLQSCAGCPLDCYAQSSLKLDCSSGCRLVTNKKNVPVASDGTEFTAVLKNGLLYQNTRFKCYDSDCGFDIPIDENHTYTTNLPEEIPSIGMN